MSETVSQLFNEVATPDLEALWMPFTHNRLFKRNPRLVTQAEGNHYVSC